MAWPGRTVAGRRYFGEGATEQDQHRIRSTACHVLAGRDLDGLVLLWAHMLFNGGTNMLSL